MKTQMPYELKVQMDEWRAKQGFKRLPSDYISWNRYLAEKELEKLQANHAFHIHNQYMETDGWMEGMEVLHVIVESRGQLMKIKWHDGNQEFFVKSQAGGWFPVDFNKSKPNEA